MSGARAEARGETAEEGSVADPPALEPKRPRVGCLVAQRFLPFLRGKVRRNRDAVRPAVANLAAGELAYRERHPRGVEAETRRQAIVEELEPVLVFERLEKKEGAHSIRLHSALPGLRRTTDSAP